MSFIPKEAQYWMNATRTFYRINADVVELLDPDTKAWRAAGTPLNIFKAYADGGLFGIQKIENFNPSPARVAIEEEAWVLQYLDNPKAFGGLDPVTLEHPVRVPAFLAYRFHDEDGARHYCADKKDLLVPCKIKLTARVD